MRLVCLSDNLRTARLRLNWNGEWRDNGSHLQHAPKAKADTETQVEAELQLQLELNLSMLAKHHVTCLYPVLGVQMVKRGRAGRLIFL